MGAHIVDGRFQSDKYPTCPAGKVPLSTKDVTAQDILWQYAQRRREVDAEFADDLETCLRADGFDPNATFDMSLGETPASSAIDVHKLADDGNCPECSVVLGSPSPCAITHNFGPGAYDLTSQSPAGCDGGHPGCTVCDAANARSERPLTLDAAIAHLEAYEAAQRGKEKPTIERRDRASVALAALVPRLLVFLRGQEQADPTLVVKAIQEACGAWRAGEMSPCDGTTAREAICDTCGARRAWNGATHLPRVPRSVEGQPPGVIGRVWMRWNGLAASPLRTDAEETELAHLGAMLTAVGLETWEPVPRAPLPPYPGDPEDTTLRDLAALRTNGWTVAVHNDYRLDGKAHTFWLFTKGERFVKGEGETDAAALAIVAERAGLVNGLPTPQGLSPAAPVGERAKYRYKPGPRHGSGPLHAWPIYDIDRSTVDMGFVWVGDTQPSPEQMATVLRGEVKLQATHPGFLITDVMKDTQEPDTKREVLHRSHAPGTSVLDLVLLAIRHLGEADVSSEALGGPKSPAYARYASAMTACGSALDDARRALMGLP